MHSQPTEVELQAVKVSAATVLASKG
eukprot:COSAG02_NODE_50567_length_319_cov_1.968182_1_plen_25_part_01